MNFIVRLFLNFFPRTFLIRASLLFKPLFDIFFKGTKFTDPINNKSYSYFFPYGYNKQRKNALCPGTFSLERHRLLWLYLKKETDFFNSNNKILHFAPEQCFHKFFKSFFKKHNDHKSVHIIGLYSNGGVHSHANHLINICKLVSKKCNNINLDELSLMAFEDPSTGGNPKKINQKDLKEMYEKSISGNLF